MRFRYESNIMDLPSRDLERFLSKVIQESEGECWHWIGKPDHAGYGHFSIGPIPYPAHRIAYRLAIGPIPRFRQVHHKCENRICVNPHHLEALTAGDHVNVTTGHPKNWTHCRRGHEFTAENTGLYKGVRRCKTCLNLRAKWKKNPEYEEGQEPEFSNLYCGNGHPLFGYNMTLHISRDGKATRLCKKCRRDAVHRHKDANRDLVLAQRKARRKAVKIAEATERLNATIETLKAAQVADPLALLTRLKSLL